MKLLISLNKNIWNGIFLIAFSIFFLIATPSQVQLYEGSDALSPRLVPYVILTMIGILGILLIFNELKENQKVAKKANISNVSEKENRSLRDLLIFIGMSSFLVFTAELIGFTFASILVLITTLRIYHVKNLFTLLIVGIVVPIAIDILYRLLNIYLPLGMWESLIY